MLLSWLLGLNLHSSTGLCVPQHLLSLQEHLAGLLELDLIQCLLLLCLLLLLLESIDLLLLLLKHDLLDGFVALFLLFSLYQLLLLLQEVDDSIERLHSILVALAGLLGYLHDLVHAHVLQHLWVDIDVVHA